MKPALFLCALLALPNPARAASQSFDVVLAGRAVGQISVSQSGGSGSLDTVLDNTPLGVADGGFAARVTGGTAYRSRGTSGGDGRRIDIDFAQGRVSEVRIDPASEATDASDPTMVPAGVLDPVRGFARVALARGCVAPYRIYDGRRVVQVGLTGQRTEGGTLVCDYAYRVTGGPGHLSPFRFRTIKMTARYAIDGGAVTGLRDIRLGAGPFTVTLVAR